MIPANTKYALDLYINEHVPTGGFLKAVLSNDLYLAFARADSENAASMREIVVYVVNKAPIACYGSERNYEEWIANK